MTPAQKKKKKKTIINKELVAKRAGGLELWRKGERHASE
jgi:hypothetical protein